MYAAVGGVRTPFSLTQIFKNGYFLPIVVPNKTDLILALDNESAALLSE